jgi:hypothetical protein
MLQRVVISSSKTTLYIDARASKKKLSIEESARKEYG